MTTPIEPNHPDPAPEPSPEKARTPEPPPLPEAAAEPVAEAVPAPSRRITIKVYGVGGAGCNAVNHIARAGLADVDLFAFNTDSQALETYAVPNKFVLGEKRARGLGAGGDPDVGRAAAEEDVEKLRALTAGADLVFVLAGLGGGTGTGAAPVLARVARESGALVLAIATLPFEFEGARRQRQAGLGLRDLKEQADAVICLPNQKVLAMLDERTSVLEGFKISNNLLAEGLRGVWRLLTQTGMINVDFADLCAVTRGRRSASSFATAEASGENRAEQVVEKLFSHPLLEGGQLLTESDAALVSIVGGPDLAMAEVNKIMEPINRQCENAHVIFGAAIDPEFTGRLSVTLIASRGHPTSEAAAAAVAERPAPPDLEFLDSPPSARPGLRFPIPTLPISAEKAPPASGRMSARSRRKRSGQQRELPLETASKGRFEKSEPTIRHGQDLDLPTYLRRGVPLN